MSDPKTEEARPRSSEASELSDASFSELRADESVDGEKFLQVLLDLKRGQTPRKGRQPSKNR